MTITRPDISYVLQCLSQLMHCQLNSHLKLAFRILKYLKQSPGKYIWYAQNFSMTLTAYVDLDYGKCLASRKSIIIYSIYLNGNLISWKSKKQPTLSRSSAEAKYRALATVVCEVIWVLKTFKDLNMHDNL